MKIYEKSIDAGPASYSKSHLFMKIDQIMQTSRRKTKQILGMPPKNHKHHPEHFKIIQKPQTYR